MKKLITILTLIAFAGTVSAATSFAAKVNNSLTTLDQKEQALNKKIDNAQAQRAKQKAEAQKKQEAQKKAVEAEKAKIKAQQEANKKAVNQAKTDVKNTANQTKQAAKQEANFWSNLFKK